MGKHRARPRPGRLIPVIGTSCGLLAAAAFTGGIRPTVVLPEAGAGVLAIADDSAPADSATSATSATSPPAGGPLEMPSIGVVAPGFDEQYAALSAASQSPPAPDPEDVDAVVEQYLPAAQEPITPPPADPPAAEPPAPTPPPAQPPAPPVDPPPPARPTDEEPPAEEPTDEQPPAEQPTDERAPAGKPPAEEPPAEQPPAEQPPAEEPPAEEPPAEQPPAEKPPAEVALALGETFDVVDAATGAVLYSIAVDGVTADLPCTAEGFLPPRNGHLLGLAVRVTTGPARPDAEAPVVRPAAFRLVGQGDTDIATDSAAACLDDGEFPSAPLGPDMEVTGTIVLDVPEATGTLAHRPTSSATRLLWQF